MRISHVRKFSAISSDDRGSSINYEPHRRSKKTRYIPKMRSIEIYIIIATVIIIGHSVYKDVYKEGITGELCILALGLGITIENTIIGQIVIASGIAVYLMGKVDGNTAIIQ